MMSLKYKLLVVTALSSFLLGSKVCLASSRNPYAEKVENGKHKKDESFLKEKEQESSRLLVRKQSDKNEKVVRMLDSFHKKNAHLRDVNSGVISPVITNKNYYDATRRHLNTISSTSDESSSDSDKKKKNHKKRCKGLNFKKSKQDSSSSKSMNGKKKKKGCKKAKAKKTDVLIIGAGMAGIRAATRLNEVAPELDVTILEASDRIGGRVESFFTKDGLVLQKGPNWLNAGGPATSLYEELVNQNGYVVDNYLNMTVFEIMCPGERNRISLLDSSGVQKVNRDIERLNKDDHGRDPMTRDLIEHNINRLMKRLAVETVRDCKRSQKLPYLHL